MRKEKRQKRSKNDKSEQSEDFYGKKKGKKKNIKVA